MNKGNFTCLTEVRGGSSLRWPILHILLALLDLLLLLELHVDLTPLLLILDH